MARYERVAQALKKELSVIIHDELKDPRLGFVTITRVELTPDLRFAKVFFSVLGKEQDYIKTKKALDSALGFMRSLVTKRLQLRLAPELLFKEDKTQEYSVRIQQVLDEIKDLETREPGKEEQSEPKKSSRSNKKK